MIDKLDMCNRAMSLRTRLQQNEKGPINIFSAVLCIENLTLIKYPLGKKISGICYKGEKSNIIVINSQMTVGRQNFSLAHELYHLYYDKKEDTSFSFIEGTGKSSKAEEAADQFASYFLIPLSDFYDDIKVYKEENKVIPIAKVIELEQYYGVSHKAMLFRLKADNIKVEPYEGSIRYLASVLGYDTELYSIKAMDKPKVLGYYITKAKALLDKGKISQGKFDELLLDAYRDDIVYGPEDEGDDIID